MTKVGEFAIERSDGAYDWVELYEPGTFDHEPLIFELSDGRWGVPYLRPLGDGDTGMLVEASSGDWYQVNKQGILLIEDWETGDKRNWGYDGGGTVTDVGQYEGTYSYRGDSNGGIQRVRDNERDHGNLPYYQEPGDFVRLFAWYAAAPDSNRDNAFLRWGFGGVYEESAYYAQWDINNESLRLIDSDGHDSLGVEFGMGYPGGEWWALEVDWGDPTITLRLVDYSDASNPTTEATVSVDDTRYNGNTYRGHQWYVWNSSGHNLYSDYAAIHPT